MNLVSTTHHHFGISHNHDLEVETRSKLRYQKICWLSGIADWTHQVKPTMNRSKDDHRVEK
jgi:hypothetical protein